jgi:hypothetical protein
VRKTEVEAKKKTALEIGIEDSQTRKKKQSAVELRNESAIFRGQ